MRAAACLVATVALVAFFSGCLSDETTGKKSVSARKLVSNARGAQELLEEGNGFVLGMKGCMEGGGVSLYNMQDGTTGPVSGGPFKRASISHDTGNPMIASYFVPIPPGGATTGIWHTSLVCKSYNYNGEERGVLEWGWVGVRIYPPPWDDGTIKRQYFVADLSFPDEEILKDLKTANGVHVSKTLDAKVNLYANLVLHTILDDEDHGVFETHGALEEWTPKDVETMRFWMLVSTAGHAHGHGAMDAEGATPKYRPISFDIKNEGQGKYYTIEPTGWLSHTRTDAHGAVPAATGNVGGMLYSGFDRTVTLGPAPQDILLEKTWTH